jgi:EmrB/QacA subfamily drug resistance transporter
MADAYERRWRALIGISVLCLVAFVDFTVVNTILPGIQRDLHATVDQLQWVMNAFFLMLVVFMVTTGRIGDIYGRRKALYAGVIVFAVASLVAGAAPSAEILIACRFVQGICAAALLTCSVGLVNQHFPENEQGRALAIFMSVTGFGMAIGPLVGGFLMSALSWRWAFYVNVPVVVIGFAIAWNAVKETPPQTGERLDWLGLAFLTPGMSALIIAIMKANDWGWTSPLFLTTAVAALLLLTVFFVVERRVEFPIVNFALFSNRAFLACTVVAITLGGFIGLGSFMAPQYLQTVRNEAPYVAGLMLLPISALVVIVPPLIGKLVDDIGPLPFIAAGQIVLVLSALGQIFFAPDSAMWFVLFGLGLFGLGWGLQQATTAVAATSPFPQAQASVVIGVLYSIWNVGSSVGLAIGGLIFERRAIRRASRPHSHGRTSNSPSKAGTSCAAFCPIRAKRRRRCRSSRRGLRQRSCRSFATPSWPATAGPCGTCLSPASSVRFWCRSSPAARWCAAGTRSRR